MTFPDRKIENLILPQDLPGIDWAHEVAFQEWAAGNPEAALLFDLFENHAEDRGRRRLFPYGLGKGVRGEVRVEGEENLLLDLKCQPETRTLNLELVGSSVDKKNGHLLYGLCQLSTTYDTQGSKLMELWISKDKFWLPTQVNQFAWMMDFLKDANKKATKLQARHRSLLSSAV